MVAILIITKRDTMAAIVYRLRMTAPPFAFQRPATHARAKGPGHGRIDLPELLSRKKELAAQRQKIFVSIRHHFGTLLRTLSCCARTRLCSYHEPAEHLHQRAAAIRLGRLLDEFDSATASEVTREEIYQAIIAHRKTAKHLPEEERAALDRQIAEYSNNQVKHKPASKK